MVEQIKLLTKKGWHLGLTPRTRIKVKKKKKELIAQTCLLTFIHTCTYHIPTHTKNNKK